jgi:hypothetical protein
MLASSRWWARSFALGRLASPDFGDDVKLANVRPPYVSIAKTDRSRLPKLELCDECDECDVR